VKIDGRLIWLLLVLVVVVDDRPSLSSSSSIDDRPSTCHHAIVNRHVEIDGTLPPTKQSGLLARWDMGGRANSKDGGRRLYHFLSYVKYFPRNLLLNPTTTTNTAHHRPPPTTNTT
jgi:hypothetical protein